MSNNTDFQLLSLSDVRTLGGVRRWKREDLLKLFGMEQEDAGGSSAE